MKITIIGPSSSGKSTLSRKISSHFNIPRLEIDRLWFDHGGHNFSLTGTGDEEEKAAIRAKLSHDIQNFLSKNNNWVIDGTYSKIQPIIADKADNVIYIKRPLFKRILSHLIRIFKNENRHPEISRWEDIKFTKVIIKRWNQKEIIKNENLAKKYVDKLIVLKNFKEIDTYFESLIKSK